VGTGHSWSALIPTDEALINLDQYNKVISLDTAAKIITVQPGIKLWQLNEYLDAQGMAMTNLGSIAEQSIAGAVSTATHGSGIQYQILASLVRSFTLIKADGSKVTLDKEKDKETFELALVSLGSLGLISEMTLSVSEAFRLHDHTSLVDFDMMLENLDTYIRDTDHFKIWWFPHVSKAVLYQYNRTQDAANDSRLRQWLMDEVLSVVVYRLLVFIGNIFPSWRPFFNTLLVKSFEKPLDRIEKSYKVFNVPAPPIHRETEWAFDVKDARSVLAAYKKLIDESDHKINFIQEIRFVKGDNFALSPAYQRDSVWVGCYLIGDRGWPELLSDFEKLARSYFGRPHWGKEFTIDRAYLEGQYPAMKAFNELRKRYDPEGKFENGMMREVFGG
jgi:L-gulonolactone oxidase